MYIRIVGDIYALLPYMVVEKAIDNMEEVSWNQEHF